MRVITADDVRDAVEKKSIMRIDHHKCSMCDHMVFYSVVDGLLFFNGACGCAWESPQLRSWQSAADYINMQDNETSRLHIMKQFGLEGF